MAEKQEEHRQKLESFNLQEDAKRARLGLHYALVISALFVLAAVALGVTGHATEGTVLGCVDIVALAGAFIYGSISRKNERQERIKLLAGQANNTGQS